MKKQKKLTMSERVLKWAKMHKKHNSLLTLVVLAIAIVLIVFVVSAQKTESINATAKAQGDTRFTYFGNITLNSHIHKTNLNESFAALRNVLKQSDYSTGSLRIDKFSNDQKTNINRNIENIMFLKRLGFTSLNIVNDKIDNVQATDLDKKAESQVGYNYLTGNGSNPINSKTVQQEINGQKVATVSFTDVESKYTDSLRNTTSISLKPRIFMPLIKNLKKNNDYVVVNVDWGIPDERNVTTRQKEYAHALSKAGADVIVGHNTVVQPIEQYNNTSIFYSLGNTTSENFLSKNKESIAVQQDWNNKNSTFKITPVKYEGGTISTNKMNKIEERRLMNNLQKENVKLEKQDGGYVYED